jgi:hypothetical protein
MIIFFGFLYYHFSRTKHKIKNKVGIKTTFLLMMKMLKAKSPTPVHFRLGQNERVFLKSSKQQTNALFEQISSRRNIKNDPNVACKSEFNLRRAIYWLQSASGLQSSKRDSAQCHGRVLLDERHRRGQVDTQPATRRALGEAF